MVSSEHILSSSDKMEMKTVLDEPLDLIGREKMTYLFFQKHLLPHMFSRFLKNFPFDFFVKISLQHLELCLKS